jgi:hypothetical protein
MDALKPTFIEAAAHYPSLSLLWQTSFDLIEESKLNMTAFWKCVCEPLIAAESENKNGMGLWAAQRTFAIGQEGACVAVWEGKLASLLRHSLHVKKFSSKPKDARTSSKLAKRIQSVSALAEASKQAVAQFAVAAKNLPAARAPALLAILDVHREGSFDKFAKANIVESLWALIKGEEDKRSANTLFEFFMGKIGAAEERDVRWALNFLFQLPKSVQLNQDKVAAILTVMATKAWKEESPLRRVAAPHFFSILNSLLRIESEVDWAERAVAIVDAELRKSKRETPTAARSALKKAVAAIDKAGAGRERGGVSLKRLLHVLSIQLVEDPTDSAISLAQDIAQAAHSLAKDIASVASSKPISTSEDSSKARMVWIDALIGLLGFDSSLIRFMVDKAFGDNVRLVEGEAIKQIMSVISTEPQGDEEDEDDDEDDEDDEEEDEEEDEDEKDESGESNEDAEEIEAALAEALAGAYDAKQEGSESDLDDEAMFALDHALAAQFKLAKEKTQSKQKSMHFRICCVDLIEAFAKRRSESECLFEIVAAVIETVLRVSKLGKTHSQLADRLESAVTKTLCNLTKFPQEGDCSVVLPVWEQLWKGYKRAKPHWKPLYENSIVFLCKLLVNSPKKQVKKSKGVEEKRYIGGVEESVILDRLNESALFFFSRKAHGTSYHNPVLFELICRKLPAFAWQYLIPVLFEKSATAHASYERSKVLNVLEVLLQQKQEAIRDEAKPLVDNFPQLAELTIAIAQDPKMKVRWWAEPARCVWQYSRLLGKRDELDSAELVSALHALLEREEIRKSYAVIEKITATISIITGTELPKPEKPKQEKKQKKKRQLEETSPGEEQEEKPKKEKKQQKQKQKQKQKQLEAPKQEKAKQKKQKQLEAPKQEKPKQEKQKRTSESTKKHAKKQKVVE